MPTATDSVFTEELAAVQGAFEELLRVRKSIARKREQTRRFRAADRRLRRAHGAVQKQLQELAVELNQMGVSPVELSRIMREAEADS